jgi:hypothetical protein
VVERKQVRDLMSSLFDGRLAEQCARMRQWQAEREGTTPVWIVLVVEGTAGANTFRVASDPDAKFRFFVKTHLQLVLDSSPSEGRLVLRTSDENETAALLLTLHKTIKAPHAPAAGTGVLPRKTQADIFLRHLCCTKGVSYQRAQRIRSSGGVPVPAAPAPVRAEYSSVAALASQMVQDPDGTLLKLTKLLGGGCVARRVWQDLGYPAPPAPERRTKRRRQSSSSSSSSARGQTMGTTSCDSSSPAASLTTPTVV